jgi:hypothetical protein
VGPRAGLDTEARGKILCPCRGSNPDRPVVQPVRHYTAWANPAPRGFISHLNIMTGVLVTRNEYKYHSTLLQHFDASSKFQLYNPIPNYKVNIARKIKSWKKMTLNWRHVASSLQRSQKKLNLMSWTVISNNTKRVEVSVVPHASVSHCSWLITQLIQSPFVLKWGNFKSIWRYLHVKRVWKRIHYSLIGRKVYTALL